MNTNSVLADFDNEVQSRCELIRVNAENVSANLQSALDITLLAIPEIVRKMPVKELMEKFDGDIQKAATYYVADTVVATNKLIPSSPKRKTQSPSGSSSKKSPSATNGNCQNSKKEVSTPSQQNTKNTTKLKTPTKSSLKTTTHLSPSNHTPTNRSSTSCNTISHQSATKKKPTTKSPRVPKKP